MFKIQCLCMSACGIFSVDVRTYISLSSSNTIKMECSDEVGVTQSEFS